MMGEWIKVLQNHGEILTGAAIILIGLFLVITLSRILKQIKRLNQSLGNITGSMQEYFEVILKEDMEEEEETEARAVQMEKEEHEKRASKEEQKKLEDEKLFNAVLQEYFS